MFLADGATPGLYVLDSQALAAGDGDGIAAAAALVLDDAFLELAPVPAERLASLWRAGRAGIRSRGAGARRATTLREPLRFLNGYGGFNAEATST